MNWKKYLTLAGGAAAALIVAYMLVREDDHQAEAENGNDNSDKKQVEKKNKNGCNMSKEDLLQVLSDMQTMNVEMKNMIDSLIKVAKECNYDFMCIYNKAKEIDKTDLLMKRQMEMPDIDKAIESYHFDPEVSEYVSKLMIVPESVHRGKSNRPILSVDKIIEIHAFMLQEIYKIDNEIQSLPNSKNLNTKLLAVVIQSIVNAKIEERFDVLSEDVEMSISAHHSDLIYNQDFTRVNIEMQTLMNKCIGESFKHICDKEDDY